MSSKTYTEAEVGAIINCAFYEQRDHAEASKITGIAVDEYDFDAIMEGAGYMCCGKCGTWVDEEELCESEDDHYERPCDKCRGVK